MNRNWLIILLYVFSAISFTIAIYQFIDRRPFDGALSIIFSICFLIGGLYNQRRIKNEAKNID